MTGNATAWLLGIILATGLALIWAGLPFRRRPTLDDRLAPYVGDRARDTDRVEALLAERVLTPFPTLERIARPYVARAAGALEQVLGGATSVRRRLDRAGSAMAVPEFRLEQLLWGAAGGGVGLAVAAAVIVRGAGSPAPLLILCGVAVIVGVLARDYRLTAQVRVRERRMLAEFPTIADLLALAVTAGVGPTVAIEKVAASSNGELAAELRRALGDTRTGAGLVDALDKVADRTDLVPLARFADGLAVAMQRGTPLADVLRAQAADVRAAHKRSLLEIGGRKEIFMMIPVVFLVLPVTVVFALYPGLVQISAVVP